MLCDEIIILLRRYIQMRYKTVGDWYHSAGSKGSNLIITVAKCSDRRSEIALIAHELVEALLCEHADISAATVDEWDFSHITADEPGDDPRAPYHAQHILATKIERLMCEAMDLPWEQHTANIAAVEAQGT